MDTLGILHSNTYIHPYGPPDAFIPFYSLTSIFAQFTMVDNFNMMLDMSMQVLSPFVCICA